MIRMALESGREINMKLVVCGGCENEWCVVAAPEFNPSFCCYCGIKFDHYDQNDGTRHKINGFPEDTNTELDF